MGERNYRKPILWKRIYKKPIPSCGSAKSRLPTSNAPESTDYLLIVPEGDLLFAENLDVLMPLTGNNERIASLQTLNGFHYGFPAVGNLSAARTCTQDGGPN